MVNIVLDTTYTLPLFGIKVKISDTFDDELREFWKNGLKGYNIYLPSICLIEVLYLLNREFRKNSKTEILNRYPIVLPSITSSNIVSIYDSLKDVRVSQIANNIRTLGHTDLIDCFIAATAISLDGIFLSRDQE